MTALDLFCGGGGASMGLHKAGFNVIGIDKEESAEYPFAFIQVSCLELSLLRRFDFIWASPPCQAFTAYKRRKDHVKEALNLIPETRALLKESGVR